MIRLSDALRLARTKLRMRRVRLVLTIVVSALLFSVLTASAVLLQGTTASLKSFSTEGYGNQFFVQGTPQVDATSPATTAAVVAELQPKHAALVAQKKALAKQLNLPYDEAGDSTLPLVNQPSQTGGAATWVLNAESPLVQEALAARAASTKVAYEDFAAAASSQGATATYRGTVSSAISSSSRGATLAIVKDGREMTSSAASGESRGLRTLVDNGWSLRDQKLLAPFVLKGQQLAVGEDGSIPMVAPFSAAEEMLGLKPLSETATPEARIQRIATVRTRIAGRTAQLCYRNTASTTLVQKAESVMKDWAANKGKPDAQEPTVQYALPTTPCAIPSVSKDIRAAEDKQVADNQEKFDRTFGLVSDPVQGVVTLRIVGLSPDADSGMTSMSLTSILSGLLSSNAGAGWISPLEATSNATVQAIFGGGPETMPLTRQLYYARFPSADRMRAFTAAQSCAMGSETGALDGAPEDAVAEAQEPVGDPTAACLAAGKGFALSPYGNSAGAIDDFTKGANTFLRWFLLGVLALAAVIMAGNIGKIVADSRRETAVFRSLGARRFHIAQIYLTYVTLVCALIAGVALAVGTGLPQAVSVTQSPALSAIAVQAFNAANVHQKFTLVGFAPMHLLAICGCVLPAGLLSATLPLLTNMRRNPITDMRDDA
ncbi:MAG: ABC transporter permease [Tetrasphaera sp.]|nr:ABC transporter permease [Tetrasphaera sp.]